MPKPISEQLQEVASKRGYKLFLWYDPQWSKYRWRMERADGGVSYLGADDSRSVVEYFRECGWVL